MPSIHRTFIGHRVNWIHLRQIFCCNFSRCFPSHMHKSFSAAIFSIIINTFSGDNCVCLLANAVDACTRSTGREEVSHKDNYKPKYTNEPTCWLYFQFVIHVCLFPFHRHTMSVLQCERFSCSICHMAFVLVISTELSWMAFESLLKCLQSRASTGLVHTRLHVSAFYCHWAAHSLPTSALPRHRQVRQIFKSFGTRVKCVWI